MADLTVSEAAARLKVSERTIRRRCESGKLKAQLKPTATGTAWHIEADSCGQAAATSAAIPAATVSSGNQSQGGKEGAATAANGAAMTAATERDVGRMEGYTARDLEINIAQAVEKAIEKAVPLAVAPFVDKIRELCEKIEKLEKQGREDAAGAPPITPLEESVQGSGTRRKLSGWQKVAARIFKL